MKGVNVAKMDDENFAVILGAFIGVAAALIAFLRGVDIGNSIMIFLLFFIFGTMFILLANEAYYSLKNWNKNHRRK